MSLLDMINEAESSEIYDINVLGGGTNLVLTPGEPTVYQIDGVNCFITPGELVIVRGQLREPTANATHPSLICQIASVGEVQGTVVTQEQLDEMLSSYKPQVRSAAEQALRINDLILVPFMAYYAPGFAAWRGWTHFVFAEFQNPDPDAVKRLEQLMKHFKWVDYVLPEGANVNYERQASNVWEKQPPTSTPNGRLAERIKNGLRLTSLTLVADERFGPNKTEYMDGNGNPQEREGFTSFADSYALAIQEYAANVGPLLKEKEVKPDDRDVALKLREVGRDQSRKLAQLTGQLADDDGGWPLRPTLGRCTVELLDDKGNPLLGKDNKPVNGELDFFGNRRATVAAAPAAEEQASESTSKVEDEPFDLGDEPDDLGEVMG